MKRNVFAICFLAIFSSVHGQQAKLSVGWPEEGFFIRGGSYMVPLDTTVHFKGFCTSSHAEGWVWELPGATPSSVEGQEVAVVYHEEGVHDVKLQATVNQKAHELSIPNGVSSGGSHFVWNISGEEEAKLDVIPLAWYGWYGGSNTLGIVKFAEYFHSPMQPACIDSVEVFFGLCKVATTAAKVTVGISKANEQGMPGEELSTTSMPASQLSNSTPTIFRFAEPVVVDGAFFVTISGFPDNAGDGIAMMCLRRDYQEKCTAYHLVADEDENYLPTGTYTWYENVEDPTSFAISPRLRYLEVSGMKDQGISRAPSLTYDGDLLHLPSNAVMLEVFTMDGTSVMRQPHPSTTVSLASLRPGLYVVRAEGQTLKVTKR